MFVGVTCLNLFMCITSLSRRANARSHTSQTYGFSPVCMRIWMVSLSFRANPFPHTVHSNTGLGGADGSAVDTAVFDPLVGVAFAREAPEEAAAAAAATAATAAADDCCTCCSAFRRVAGCIDPPSAYGSVNGIRLGRGMLGGISGDLRAPTRTPPSNPIPTSSGTVKVLLPLLLLLQPPPLPPPLPAVVVTAELATVVVLVTDAAEAAVSLPAFGALACEPALICGTLILWELVKSKAFYKAVTPKERIPEDEHS
uniref:Uncharacterized protein n=1 Tax=Anopheles culicifacies TaxID=139723 RepID=A0A182LWV9_9DIPT